MFRLAPATGSTAWRWSAVAVALVASLSVPVAARAADDRPGTMAAPGVARAEDEKPTDALTFRGGIHYSTGKYGGPHSTEVIYVPLHVRYDSTWGAAGLTVPYLSMLGHGETLSGGGVLFDDRSDKEVSSSGLGDVLAMFSYTVYRGTSPRPWVDLTAIVKFGTADPDKDLGSGKNDYAVQADAYQVARGWEWFATLGYKVPGSTGFVTFQRVVYGLAGASHAIGKAFKAGLMWSGQQPRTEGADPEHEVTAFGSWALSPRDTLSSYLSHGLTRASPDWATGITFSRSY